MKTERKALLLALVAGLCFWVLDAALCFFIFHEGTFLDLLILKVSFYHILVRLMAILVAVVFALVGSSHAAQHRQNEEALRESEKKYRSLFVNMLEGFAYCKILLDKNNQPVDFVYLEVNDAFERLTGLRKEDVIGKRVTQAIPGIKESHPELFSIYGHVALTGKEDKIEVYFKPFNIWLSISVHSPQKEYFVAVFDNITERKKAEEDLRWYQSRLRSQASKLALAEERQRRRIARGLHDDVGQDLLSVKMRLEELCKSTTSAESADALEQILKPLEKAIQKTRSLVFDLSPAVLYELGLEPAVKWLTEKTAAELGIAVVFEDDGQDKPLDEDSRIILFRAVRELLTNVAKHAQAKHIRVSARRDGPNMAMQVEDNGVGFDPGQVGSRRNLHTGFGLFDIRERLSHLGGSFQLESKPGRGTRATLLAPLNQQAPAS